MGSEEGRAWEDIVQRRARSDGLLIIKHELTGRYIGGGGARLIKSELDFSVFTRKGRVAFFDAKSWGIPYFDHSDLLQQKEPRDHQIARAVMYEDWGVPSGFLCWFRPIDEVVFYSGRQIATTGPGNRFLPGMGLRLGSVQDFSLKPILGSLERV